MKRKKTPIDPNLLAARTPGDVIILASPARQVGSQWTLPDMEPGVRCWIMSLHHFPADDRKAPPTLASLRPWDPWLERWDESVTVYTEGVTVEVERAAGAASESTRKGDDLDPLQRDDKALG